MLDSEDDFMPAKVFTTNENNVKQKEQMIPVFKNLSQFSDIPDQTILQVIGIISPSSSSEMAKIRLSDGEYWVTSNLDKVGFLGGYTKYGCQKQ